MSQFCRACGTDLRAVRAGLESADAATDPAVAARGEIARAVAAKIRELQGAGELKSVAGNVLPKLAEFLEPPEEKRLKRIRAGMIVSAAGLGAIITFVLAAVASGDKELFSAAAFFGIAFFVGLAMIINGKMLSVQRDEAADRSKEAALQNALDRLPSGQQKELTAAKTPPPSVIEHTTHRLSSEPAITRRKPSSIENEG